MDNIKLELAPPYRGRDDNDASTIARVTFQGDFKDQFTAIKFLGDLQKLIASYQPEAE